MYHLNRHQNMLPSIQAEFTFRVNLFVNSIVFYLCKNEAFFVFYLDALFDTVKYRNSMLAFIHINDLNAMKICN